MKTKILILLMTLSFSFYSCGDDDEILPPIEENMPIVGKWKLFESYISPGTPVNWVEIEDGYEVSFNSDMTFTDFNNCLEGTYSIEEDTMMVDCTESMSPAYHIYSEYSLTFEEGDVIEIAGPCIEGCAWRLRKIE